MAVDPHTAQSYRHRYPEIAERIRVVPVAVKERGCKVHPAELTPSSVAPVTFVFVGRLSVEKRIDRILEAMKSGILFDARFVIAGSGPDEERLRTLARGSRVTFLGNVAHEALASLYREAHALVLASEFEGLPTAALEAISFGCPVVAPLGCGMDWLEAGGAGVLVEGFENLPECMLAAAKLRMSRRPISLPPEFTWSTVGPRIVAIYQEVAPEVAT